jgi:hypothetical protein
MRVYCKHISAAIPCNKNNVFLAAHRKNKEG